MEESAAATGAGATTKAVRVPGSPSLERLRTWTVWSVHSGVVSWKTIPGKGWP
jgi:hypothetical protein